MSNMIHFWFFTSTSRFDDVLNSLESSLHRIATGFNALSQQFVVALRFEKLHQVLHSLYARNVTVGPAEGNLGLLFELNDIKSSAVTAAVVVDLSQSSWFTVCQRRPGIVAIPWAVLSRQ
jgi:hypothetical protein